MSHSIKWTAIKALSFDIFGTLVDWENGIASTARATIIGPYLPESHHQLLKDIERHDTTVQWETPGMKQPDVIAEGLRRYAHELGVVEQPTTPRHIADVVVVVAPGSGILVPRKAPGNRNARGSFPLLSCCDRPPRLGHGDGAGAGAACIMVDSMCLLLRGYPITRAARPVASNRFLLGTSPIK